MAPSAALVEIAQGGDGRFIWNPAVPTTVSTCSRCCSHVEDFFARDVVVLTCVAVIGPS